MTIFEKLPCRIIPAAILLALLVYPRSAPAHSSLLAQEQKVHNYTAVLGASADVPAIYSGYAVTYALGLFDANHSEVPFDFLYVEFSAKQEGAIIFSGMLPGSTGLMPDTTLNIAMPSAGAYEAEVTFMRKERSASGVNELAKAKFSFDVIENPSDAPSVWKNRYLWAGAGLVLGLLLWPVGYVVSRRLHPRQKNSS